MGKAALREDVTFTEPTSSFSPGSVPGVHFEYTIEIICE